MAFLENVDRAKLQKILLISITALVLVALTLLLVIIIMSIDPTGLTETDMKFTELTVGEKDLNTGSLLLADKDHPYKAKNEAWLDLVGCTAYMEDQPDATGIDVPTEEYYKKNYIPWKAMRLNKTAMAATHKMLTAAKNSVKQNPLTIDAAYDVVKFGSSYGYDTALMILLSDYDSTAAERKPLSSEYRSWLSDNAVKYGFVSTEVEDAYRYVGIPHADYMSSKKLDLASYIAYLKENTSSERGLSVEASDGAEYYIYYVSAKAGDTVKVPEDGNSVLSGTNEGGIIVTAKLDK